MQYDTCKVLVTGAAGFIGSHLADHLLEQVSVVIGLDNFCDFYPPTVKKRNLEAACSHDSFTLIEADIRNRDDMLSTFARHRPAIVIHLAAMAGVRPSIERPDLYAAVNVGGTVHLLDAAIAHDTQKFIFASSSSVYGNNPKVPFAEDDAVDQPISPYAATKRAGELLCLTYANLHGLAISCLRFFTVFGPRQRPDLAIHKFLSLVRNDEPISMFGDGTTSRDYTYIRDIVACICAAMEHCHGYRIYNLGGDRPVMLKDMIATIASVTGKKIQINSKPMQAGDVQQTWADLTRSRAELDYEPTTPLADGITRQWQWLLHQVLSQNEPRP